MAILQKRKSSKTLPEARGLQRSPLSSVIQGLDRTPSISGDGAGSITSAGGTGGSNALTTRPSITSTGGAGGAGGAGATRPSLTSTTGATKTPALTTKKPLTTAVKPAVTTKPAVTNKLPTTTPTKTTSPNVSTRPSISTAPRTPTSTTGKVVNALTGSLIGAGSKLLFDKLTGKPTVKPSAPKQPAGGAKPPAGTQPVVNPKVTPPPVKPPVTSTVLTEQEVQDELDRLKAAEESFGPPTGAIDNGDGTYSVVEDGFKITYGADGSVIGMESAESSGESVSAPSSEFYQDEDGNIYTMTAGGSYELYSTADGEISLPEEEQEEEFQLGDTTELSDEFYQDDEGNLYTMSDGGSYELYSTADGETDFYPEEAEEWQLGDSSYFEDEPIQYAGEDSYNYDNYYDYNDYAKSGGLITMMKKGGVPRFEDGGYSDTGEEVQDWQNVNYNYGENNDPSLTGEKSLYSQSGPIDNSYLRNLALNSDESLASTTSGGNDFTPVPGRQYFDDGSYIDTFDDGSTMTYDYDGNLVDTTDGYQTTVDDEGNFIVTDGYGGITVYDPDGNLIPVGGGRTPQSTASNNLPNTNIGTPPAIESAGGTGGAGSSGAYSSGSQLLKDIYQAGSGLTSGAYDKLTGALGTTAGAAGAGALFATLLGSDFSGGGGGQNLGVDMSKVGVINPRTTDFGIGPTNFVGYEDYGTGGGEYTPNEELLRNLNAPGFNPVNEGDYGYEEAPAESAKMASGGLSSMSSPVASYYTFGQPADILANLGMRPQPPMNPPDAAPQIGQQQPPQQAQQQGLPQQAPPQMQQQMPPQMPQQGLTPQQGMMPQQQGLPPPMRKGGLPHVSNVPSVQGRMDFRQGSAVHGEGDGQSDDIPAMLADGEYVIDSETVAQIGNGSTKAGAQALDKFRENIRSQKRSAPINKIPPKTKALTSYLKG